MTEFVDIDQHAHTSKSKSRQLKVPLMPSVPIPTQKQGSKKKLQSPPLQATRRSTRQHRPNPRYIYDAPTRSYAAQHIAANEWATKICHIYNDAGKKESIDSLLRGTNADIWSKSMSNELGRLAQGINDIPGNDAMEFISLSQVPRDRKVTYANMVCDYRPLKSDPHRVRLTVGGDKLEYYDDATSPAATLLETKFLLNSTISDAHKGAKFFTLDITDFFLQSLMERPEYMRIHSKYFMEDIREKYNIVNIIAPDGYVYCRIKRGMYGLKQAARLAYNALVSNLGNHGYRPDKFCPNIWTHDSLQTKFCLCVDDFGVKYTSTQDAYHLIESLQNYYDITIDWGGSNFCGLNIDWHYKNGYVDIYMDGYVKKALAKLQHHPPPKPQYAPHKWNIPVFGKNQQFAPPEDTTPKLKATGISRVQSVVGTFLFYARAIDNTILTALNEIAAFQAAPTETTNEKIQMLLDYLYTYPDARIRFIASDMVLHIESDAAYLVAPKARSRIGGFYYCGSAYTKPLQSTEKINGPVHVECKILRRVVSSAAEAETAGIFVNCQTAIDMRNMMIALGHPQPATPVKTDNSTATAFVNDTFKKKKSKSWDMNYHWISDQSKLNKFYIYWDKGCNNKGDYPTKHHPPSHHKQVRPTYILKGFHTSVKPENHLSARVCYSYGTVKEQFTEQLYKQTNVDRYNNSRCQSRLVLDNGQLLLA